MVLQESEKNIFTEAVSTVKNFLPVTDKGSFHPGPFPRSVGAGVHGPDRAAQVCPQNGEGGCDVSTKSNGPLAGRRAQHRPPGHAPILGEAYTRSVIERMNTVVFGE
jgi:hypothetical protein